MRRWLFTLCSAVSLLLCAAACVLWVRSHVVADVWEWRRSGSRAGETATASVRLHSVRGVLAVNGLRTRQAWQGRVNVYDVRTGRTWVETTPRRDWSRTDRTWTRLDPADVGVARRSWYQRLGFDAHRQVRATQWDTTSTWGVLVPHWAVALLTAAPPALWEWRRRTARRLARAAGRLCARCGYDLRATPDRCPECGGEPARAAGV